MVQRWDYFAASEEFEPFDRGEWVKYEDYAALENAVNALLVDVKARYPNQDLYCPFMRELERLTK